MTLQEEIYTEEQIRALYNIYLSGFNNPNPPMAPNENDEEPVYDERYAELESYDDDELNAWNFGVYDREQLRGNPRGWGYFQENGRRILIMFSVYGKIW